MSNHLHVHLMKSVTEFLTTFQALNQMKFVPYTAIWIIIAIGMLLIILQECAILDFFTIRLQHQICQKI